MKKKHSEKSYGFNESSITCYNVAYFKGVSDLCLRLFGVHLLFVLVLLFLRGPVDLNDLLWYVFGFCVMGVGCLVVPLEGF